MNLIPHLILLAIFSFSARIILMAFKRIKYPGSPTYWLRTNHSPDKTILWKETK